MNAETLIQQTFDRHIETAEATRTLADDITAAGRKIADSLGSGGKVLLAGNGGSAADAQHWATEWMIRLHPEPVRKALPAIALTTDTSLLTAGANDIGYENVFARQIEGLAQNGDVVILISTSGGSENLLRAANMAHEQGATVIGVLGKGGGNLAPLCDMPLIVPSSDTGHVQEMHIIIGHLLCELSEQYLRGDLEG